MNRRNWLVSLFAFVFGFNRLGASEKRRTFFRVQWVELTATDIGQPGDFWSSYDPNMIESTELAESRGKSWCPDRLNIQMQAIHAAYYGSNYYRKDTGVLNCGNGAYYRPVGLVEIT